MDRLIQPCIDDDDKEEKKQGAQLPWMVPSYDDDTDDMFRVEDNDEMMVLDDGSKEEQPQYCLEKYFSNDDI